MKERPIDSLKLKCKVCVFNSRIEYFSEFSLLQMIVLEKKTLPVLVRTPKSHERKSIHNKFFIHRLFNVHPSDRSHLWPKTRIYQVMMDLKKELHKNGIVLFNE